MLFAIPSGAAPDPSLSCDDPAGGPWDLLRTRTDAIFNFYFFAEAEGVAETTAGGAPPTAEADASTGEADADTSGAAAPEVDSSCDSTTGLDVASTFVDESQAVTRAAKRDTITNDFITIFSPDLSERREMSWLIYHNT